MQSKIFLPHFIAVTIELKLSSKSIMPEAYFAIYVPDMPIANPISAFFNAGASFVPSPVMATIFPKFFSPVANRYLSSGDDRASTHKLSATSLKLLIFRTVYPYSVLIRPPTKFLKSLPSMTEVSSPLVSGSQ